MVVCHTGLTAIFISSKELELRHRRETAPMQRGCSMQAERIQVLGRAVACIALPAIVRMIERGLPHDPVTMLLGDDRSCRNAWFNSIAANDRPCIPVPFRPAPLWREITVNQDFAHRFMPGQLFAQRRDSERHRQHCRPEDIESIDFIGFDNAHRPSAAAFDLFFQASPARGGQLLGIVQPRRARLAQDDRCRHDRACQWPPARLVYPDDQAG